VKIVSGVAEPLGVTLTERGVNVALYSAHAKAAYFCLYDEAGAHEVARFGLTLQSGEVYCAAIEGVRAGARYGFRVDGPFDPARGHRFDASKLLADPWGAALDRPYQLHASMFEFGADSGPFAPKSIVLAPGVHESGRQRVAWSQTILYELNLRAFTRLDHEIPAAARGTFAGLAHPRSIAHLAKLGVTSVEIMPADAFVDERHLPPLGLTNAWGYNPVVLGVPDPRLAPGGWADVRAATDALHGAGMEAILDVVLNHNGESDAFGPTLSFRGLDNASYFRLVPSEEAHYVNDAGCGNCLALDRPIVVAMAIAALRRWMTLGGIDGFRFDLATAMGRRSFGFDAAAPMFEAIRADPVLGQAKLIAEPWDIGPGGYRLGQFPPGWGEWNDRFRDGVRRFWRGDPSMRGEFATRIAGSRDLFADAPTPSKSVNFVTAHDGFTLADLVSYERKHNDANGEGNRDGSNNNYSWNNGVEGPSEDARVRDARGRDMRNLLATLFVARGAPMLSMGAEIGHSQKGNNNAYAQDNTLSWLDWGAADQALLAFTRRLIALRRAHPALSSDAWLTGKAPDASSPRDIEWRDADRPLVSPEQWQEPSGGVLVAAFASQTNSGVDRVTVAFNRGHGEATLQLPEARPGMAWRVSLDTALSEGQGARFASGDDRLSIAARSTLIIAEIAAPDRPARVRRAEPEQIDALAQAAGIAPEWWDVAGTRTAVSHDTKIALLAALRLPAESRAQATQSLQRLVEETSARRIPHSLVRRLGASSTAPLRSDPQAPERAVDLTVETEDGQTIGWRSADSQARRFALPDGREIVEREIALPPLPVGRHQLFVDAAACALTIAPPTAYLPEAARRRRFGLSAQLYAQRRNGAPGAGDQGAGDFTTLGRLGEIAGRAGAATLGVNPLHALFSSDRSRASPYHPSDRRFLDPLHIDALDGDGLPEDAAFQAAAAACAGALAAAASSASINYEAVWRTKRALLAARWAAFERARVGHPNDPIFAEHAAFVRAGGEALRRFAVFEAISLERQGEDWRQWPEPFCRGDAAALNRKAEERADDVAFARFLQWLADRQLAKAAARAKAGGLEFGLYRDLAVGAAPDGAEAWARASELALGASIGAPPDPFSAHGQIWNLPPPDPLAGAREGWRGLSALYGANMRHAGLLRIDHAMGLTRLFVIPDGAKPAQGAYVAYPLDDLIGQIALESQRAQCMIVGEDLGTVPDGFRDALAGADILGTRVLWFERRGQDFLAPQTYPAPAVACASTHDLPTLAGWWNGADIAERMSLGLVNLDEAHRQIAERSQEKRALVQALQQAGVLAQAPDLMGPLSHGLAGAVHAFVSRAASFLAMAQLDDLAGETLATNLPGTDRERPNWRHRLANDVETVMNSARAKAIIDALAAGRK